MPTAILVHETYNPGAVVKVTHYPKWGREQVLWEGKDPTPSSAGGRVAIAGERRRQNRPHQSLYRLAGRSGWNEIDAVGLDLANGNVIWAESATASSSYGSGNPYMSSPWGITFSR